MSIIVKRNVANWYQSGVGFSMMLMLTFVSLMEKQAVDSIETFKKARLAQNGEYEGVDPSDFGLLDEMFKEIFPSLQRRSALLTLWGYFEHELDRLCMLYKTEKGFSLGPSDLRGDTTIDRSTAYLEKVVGLKGLKALTEWDALKKLQRVRNIIAHNNGKLKDHEGKPKLIIEIMHHFKLDLDDSDEILVPDGFLPKAFYIWEAYFSKIDKAIKVRENVSSPSPSGPPEEK